MAKRRRRCITLIEMMIVMFLIALITGVLAYNLRGALDKGKAFKSHQAIERIESILLLALAEDPKKADKISEEWKNLIEKSPLVKDASKLQTDGWGNEFVVELEGEELKITSPGLDEYYRKYSERRPEDYGK